MATLERPIWKLWGLKTQEDYTLYLQPVFFSLWVLSLLHSIGFIVSGSLHIISLEVLSTIGKKFYCFLVAEILAIYMKENRQNVASRCLKKFSNKEHLKICLWLIEDLVWKSGSVAWKVIFDQGKRYSKHLYITIGCCLGILVITQVFCGLIITHIATFQLLPAPYIGP